MLSRSPVAWAWPDCEGKSRPESFESFHPPTRYFIMKIKSVRARIHEWKGKTIPHQGNFCSNAMDMIFDNKPSPHAAGADTMNTFRFHCWTVVEVETDDGIVGLGNVALAPLIAKAIIDENPTPLIFGEGPRGQEDLKQRMYPG